MVRNINKITSIMLILTLFVSIFVSFSSIALADDFSGTCGTNVNWKLESGVLTISGSGDMIDYSEMYPAPWYNYATIIQRVVIENGVESVGNMAFYKCTNLTTVVLAESVRILGSLAFSDCGSLVQIYMPKVQEMGWACFYDCKALVNIDLPSTLTFIGDKAFYGCRNLAGITIPESVTHLGNSAFTYCSNMVYANVLGSIDQIPYWTFYGCSALWELYLPESVSSVGYDAVAECPNLYTVEYNGSNEVKKELQAQLDKECTLEQDRAVREDVEYKETVGAIISTVTTIPLKETDFPQTEERETTINVNIKDQSGWSDLVDTIINLMEKGEKPNVIVQVQEYSSIEQGALDRLVDMDVTITIHTSDNVYFDVVLNDQTSESIKGGQNLKVAVSRNPAGTFMKLLGDVVTYTAVVGSNSYNITVRFPLGTEAARQTATLYKVKNKKVSKISSVIVDDAGMAEYNLAGTVSGEYLIALNVANIDYNEVNVPKALAKEYGINYDDALTDENGTKYIVTGSKNALGISFGTLTLIIVGGLVGSILVVGAIMVTINKQQKKKNIPHRR